MVVKKQTILIVGVLIMSIIVSACSVREAPQEMPPEIHEFAQCLSDNGATMYGTEWCSYCNEQKSLFGDAFSNINYVDCDQNKQACNQAGVRGYPTWVINEESLPGVRSFSDLSQRTSCTIATNA